MWTGNNNTEVARPCTSHDNPNPLRHNPKRSRISSLYCSALCQLPALANALSMASSFFSCLRVRSPGARQKSARMRRPPGASTRTSCSMKVLWGWRLRGEAAFAGWFGGVRGGKRVGGGEEGAVLQRRDRPIAGLLFSGARCLPSAPYCRRNKHHCPVATRARSAPSLETYPAGSATLGSGIPRLEPMVCGCGRQPGPLPRLLAAPPPPPPRRSPPTPPNRTSRPQTAAPSRPPP